MRSMASRDTVTTIKAEVSSRRAALVVIRQRYQDKVAEITAQIDVLDSRSIDLDAVDTDLRSR